MDYNATTPVDPRVVDVMLPYLTTNFANAHSAHYFGSSISKDIEAARGKIADLLSADTTEITFTSGSTEAINIAIKGIAYAFADRGKHIITVSTEHHAVLDTCKYLENNGFELTYLPVDKGGLIKLTDLQEALRADTILVSVMFVNNETGVIQPIKEIATLSHEAGALFMTDATQAIGKIVVNVDELGIDVLCLSGHKIYAPKGIGALYLKKELNLQLPTFLHGGGHERGLRSGTLNVPSIIALGTACEFTQNEQSKESADVAALRDLLERRLLEIDGSFINGNTSKRTYNVTNICFPGLDATILVAKIRNLAVSNGAACTSAVVEPSHVLKAMGLSDEDAFASIRFSLGRFTTFEDIEKAIVLIQKEIRILA